LEQSDGLDQIPQRLSRDVRTPLCKRPLAARRRCIAFRVPMPRIAGNWRSNSF
jgi:hypothetical protein